MDFLRRITTGQPPVQPQPARGTSPEQPAAAEPTDRYTPSDPASGGLSQMLQGLGRLRGMMNFRPQLNDDQNAAMDRMIRVMPELAGADGRFNRGDIEPIVNSVQGDLAQEVDSEIGRRAQDRVDGARPLARPLVRLGARVHLRRHYDDYFDQGMGIANQQVRDGLNAGFDRMGAGQSSPDPNPRRNISLQQLQQYGEDSRVLDQIRQQAEARGLPHIIFPNGMSVADLQAIRNGTFPPNGQIAPKR